MAAHGDKKVVVEAMVSVSVFGVAGLIFGQGSQDLPSPLVKVTSFGKVRETKSEANVRECTFNYDFVFSKRCKVEELMKDDVLVEVYHSSWTGQELLGRVTFSNELVYAQRGPNHMVPRGWFPVAAETNPAETKGFVELSVGVFIAGDTIRRLGLDNHASLDEHAELKSRVVKMPNPAALNLFQLTVHIHQARSLMAVSGLLSESCDPFVEVAFNGITQRTKTLSNSVAPVWNEEVNVPFMHPCWDSDFAVKVFSDGGMAHAHTLLGSIHMRTDDFEHELPPTWFYFHSAPKRHEHGEVRPSVFAGQLLISAKVERTQRPILGVSTTRNVTEPLTEPHVVRIDISKIAFDLPDNSPDLPSQVYVTVSIGSERTMEPIRSQPASSSGGSPVFMWDPPEAGVLDEAEVSLPTMFNTPCENCRLCLIVNVYVAMDSWISSKATRYMFCAIPIPDVLNWDPTSKWYNMYKIGDGVDSLAAGIILMNINVGPKKKAPKRRESQKVFKSAMYHFRANIFQATNLPPAVNKAFPDPFVVIEFGSARLMTKVQAQEVCPGWFEVCEAKVKLPVNEMQRPDVHVFIFDKEEDQIDLIAKMAYSTRKAGALPVTWRGPPTWHNLQPKPGAAPTAAKLLASFELIPSEKFQPASSIKAKTKDCRVELYLLGVRFRKKPEVLEQPVVLASWARGKQSVEKATSVGEGSGGQFNFVKKLVLEPCALSTNSIFQDWVHIRLLDMASESEDLTPLAHATLHLTPRLPWLDDSLKKKREIQFRFQRQSLLRAGVKSQKDSLDDSDSESEPSKDRTSLKKEDAGKPKGPRKSRTSLPRPVPRMAAQAKGPMSSKKILKSQERELAKAAGWMPDSIEASNAQCMEEKLLDNVASRMAQGSVGPSQVDEEDEFLNDVIAKFSQAFTWPLHTDEDQTLANHPDLATDLEQHLPPEQLPYDRAPLFMEDGQGVRLDVGVLKYKLRVVDLSMDSATLEKEDTRWQDEWEQLREDLRSCQDLRVRAYMLSADGLIPKSGNRDCSTFLWLMAGVAEKDTQASHIVMDDSSIQEHTVNPDFMKCYPFDRIGFPQNALMRFAVMEATAGAAQIGSTTLDIEDRWFHQKYRAMVEKDEVPIETRVLYDGDSIFTKGNLRLWIEVLTEQMAASRPNFTKMPSNEPAFFQLRVVIWKTHQVTWEDYSGEEQMPNLYITGNFKLDDDTPLEETTDTHHCAREGNGTFNWRMLFDIRIPSKHPRLLVQVWNWDYLGSSEICNVKLDLAADFVRARKHSYVLELPRGRVPLTNPAFQGRTRGFLELEAALWPMEEAKVREVGRGRDEPNEEPFCDPNEPALLEGRKHLVGVNLLEGIADAGQWAYSAAKLSACLYILFYVIAFIVSGTIAIITAQRVFSGS